VFSLLVSKETIKGDFCVHRVQGSSAKCNSEWKGLNRDLGIVFPQGTLALYLNHLCPYFTMIREFQNFGEELNCNREVENSTKYPPNTFIAYWTVLKEFLNDFNSLIIQIEVKVKKQGMNF
jgi:hypothetical protein